VSTLLDEAIHENIGLIRRRTDGGEALADPDRAHDLAILCSFVRSLIEQDVDELYRSLRSGVETRALARRVSGACAEIRHLLDACDRTREYVRGVPEPYATRGADLDRLAEAAGGLSDHLERLTKLLQLAEAPTPPVDVTQLPARDASPHAEGFIDVREGLDRSRAGKGG
jgi:hypothetical protein